MGLDPISLTIGAGLLMSSASTGFQSWSQFDAASEAKAAADKQAALDLMAANEEAALIADKANRLKSGQRAAIAGAGVDLDSGSATELTGETDRLAEQDVLAVLRKARRQAVTTVDQGRALADTYTAKGVGDIMTGVGTLLNFATTAKAAGQNSKIAGGLRAGTIKSGVSGQSYGGLSLLGDA